MCAIIESKIQESAALRTALLASLFQLTEVSESIIAHSACIWRGQRIRLYRAAIASPAMRRASLRGSQTCPSCDAVLESRTRLYGVIPD